MIKKLTVGCDLDGVIFNFEASYIKRFKKLPNHDWAITRNVNNILIKERDFWVNMPILQKPEGFIPKLYCSARVSKKSWSKRALEINNLPNSPLFQVPGYNIPKSKYIKGRIEVFIEDSAKNFLELNSAGIPCLLMDSPSNRYLGEILRIYSLNYDEIEEVYYLGKEFGIFEQFDLYI